MQPLVITSKRIQVLLGVLILLILICFAFMIGAKAGERRSRHFCNWSENYPEMMRPHGDARPMITPFRPMPLPNGTFGRVLSTTGTSILIEGQDRFQQSVLINSSTTIRTDQGETSSTAIQPTMEVGVFGKPNQQGQIEAYLIRLFPARR